MLSMKISGEGGRMLFDSLLFTFVQCDGQAIDLNALGLCVRGERNG